MTRVIYEGDGWARLSQNGGIIYFKEDTPAQFSRSVMCRIVGVREHDRR